MRFIASLIVFFSLSGCSRSADSYVETGNKFFEQGNYEDATLNYRKAIQQNDRHGEAYYRLGLCAIKQENGAGAFQAINRAVELLPDRDDVKVTLADLVLGGYQADPKSQSLYDLLAKLSTELLQKNPNQFDGLRMKGNLALLDRKPAEAVAYFQKAQEMKPFQEYVVVGYVEGLLLLGQVQKAEELTRGMIERKKDFGIPYDILYKHYMASNRIADAEGMLRTKIANNPQRVEFALQLAAHYGKAGNHKALQTVLNETLDREKTQAGAYLRVGDFYALSRDFDSALATYERAKAAHPTSADECQKRVAAVRSAQGRMDEAVAILADVHRRKADDWEASGSLGDLLLRRARGADLETAISLYEAVVKQKPGQSSVLYNLGRAYMAKGDLPKARKALSEAARTDPAGTAPQSALAALSLAEREPESALRGASELLTRAPGDPLAALLKFSALLQLARYEEARVELEKLAQRFPQSREVKIQEGLLEILSKNYGVAERIFAKLAASVPGDARVFGGLVEAYSSQRQFKEAIRFLESELQKSPESDVLRRLLAGTAARAGQYDRAISEYTDLLKRNPRDSAALMGLGDAYRERGDLAAAIGQFTKATEVSPNEPVLYLLTGFAQQQSGLREGAIASYRKVLTLDAKNGIAMNNLAYLLATGSGKELDEALDLAKRAVVSGNGVAADSRDTLGWIYLKKGMTDSALQIFEGVTREHPRNAAMQYHLGLARIGKSDFAGAKKALQAALTGQPSETEAGAIRAALAGIQGR